MENKKVESNIFSSVVTESTVNPEENAVLVIQLVVLVTPVADSDIKGCGLNQ